VLDTNTVVHPAYRERGLEDWLLARAEEWARARQADARITARPVVLRIVSNYDNAAKHARLMTAGYSPVRHDWVMRIDMTEPPPRPELPPGVRLRSFERGKDERAVHAAIQEAFRDVWGHDEDMPYHQWAAWLMEHPDWSPAMSYLAEASTSEPTRKSLNAAQTSAEATRSGGKIGGQTAFTDSLSEGGGEIAGASMCFDFFNGGWVRQLGVRRPWRKKGLGLALLRQIFGEYYRRGIYRVGLGVDAESLTGATRLYERAGMRPVAHFARYEKTLAPEGGATSGG
jgi:GNAT superfamily N-acetyltransferase